MIHLGDRLGLYRSMAGAGPMKAAELASVTGLQERWLLEWLRGQAAAGLIESDDGETFELSRDGRAVLADSEDSLLFAAGAFRGAVAAPEVVDRLAEAFQSGIGLSYNDLGPTGAHAVERMTEPWTRLALVPAILPALAAAFPAAQFDGFDPSEHAISRARARLADRGLGNVDVKIAGAADLPADHRYDFIMTLDCIHDMPHPAEAIAAIRRAIRPDGTWLIKDIRSAPAWRDNLRNPVLAMLYGISVASCMSSSLSEPGGAGLGTLGFNPEVARRMCTEAGFTHFAVHDFDDPANLYYEVRP